MSLLRPPSSPYLCLIWEPTGWNLSDFQMFRKKITGEPDQHLLPEATKGVAVKGWLCAFQVLILCPTHTGLVFPSSEVVPGWLGCAGILNSLPNSYGTHTVCWWSHLSFLFLSNKNTCCDLSWLPLFCFSSLFHFSLLMWWRGFFCLHFPTEGQLSMLINVYGLV